MSSESGDVKITVDIILGSNFDQASSKILQVAESLKAMGTASQQVANNLNGLDVTAIRSVNILGKMSNTGKLSVLRYDEQGEAVRNLMKEMGGLGTSSVELNNKYATFMDTTGNAREQLESLKDEFNNTTSATPEQVNALNALYNQYGKLAPMLEVNDMSLNDFEKTLAKAKLSLAMSLDPGVYDKFQAELQETGMSLDQFDTKYTLSAKTITKFMGNFTTLSNTANNMGISVRDLITIMPELGDQFTGNITKSGMLKQMIWDLANYTDLTQSKQEAYRTQLEKLGYSTEEVTTRAQALVYETQNINRAQMEFRGMLGVSGNVAMQFSRQLFWVGLGGMFMSMSMDRMLSKGAQLRQQTLSMIRAQISLKQQYKDLKQTLEEYGAGSDEAKEAIQNYNLALEDNKVQMESLRNTARSEAMTTLMFLSSLTGQVFGMGSQLVQALGPLLYQMMTMVAVENGLTKSIDSNTIAQIMNNVFMGEQQKATAVGIILKNVDKKATQGQFTWTQLLTGAINRNNIASLARNTIAIAGVGALAMLPVVIGSYVISMAMADQQINQLSTDTKTLEKNINKLRKGSGIVDLTEATDVWTDSMYTANKQVDATNMKVDNLHSYTSDPMITQINPKLTSKTNFVNVGNLTIYGGEQNPTVIADAVLSKLKRTLNSSGVNI